MNQPLAISQNIGVVPSGNFKRAGGLRGIRSAIRARGGNIEELFPAFGLCSQMFDHPDSYVNYSAVARLLEYCAIEFEEPHFGLKIGSTHTIDILGPMTVLLSACGTVGEALFNVGKYIYVHSPGATCKLAIYDQHACLSYRVNNPGLIACRQINEMSMATAFRIVWDLAGEQFDLCEVQFINSRPYGGDRSVRDFFGAPVSYEQDLNALIFPASILSRQTSLDTSSVVQLAQQTLDALAPKDSGDLVARVEAIILHLLPLGACNLSTLASQFGLSTRSLQMRLKSEGTDFRALVRAQRERLAKSYVGSTQTPISQIATLLGFSDQAVFTRAFVDWTGISPARYRAASKSAVLAAKASESRPDLPRTEAPRLPEIETML